MDKAEAEVAMLHERQDPAGRVREIMRGNHRPHPVERHRRMAEYIVQELDGPHQSHHDRVEIVERLLAIYSAVLLDL